jgi:hypothetical protein
MFFAGAQAAGAISTSVSGSGRRVRRRGLGATSTTSAAIAGGNTSSEIRAWAFVFLGLLATRPGEALAPRAALAARFAIAFGLAFGRLLARRARFAFGDRLTGGTLFAVTSLAAVAILVPVAIAALLTRLRILAAGLGTLLGGFAIVIAVGGVHFAVLILILVIIVALAALLFEAGAAFVEDAVIMVRELQEIFGLDPVPGELRVARQRLVFLVSWAALPRERLSCGWADWVRSGGTLARCHDRDGGRSDDC